MKLLKVLVLTMAAISASADSRNTTVCGVDVVKVAPGTNADEPDDVTVMTAEEVLKAVPESCPGKPDLARAVKAQHDAEQRLALAQSDLSQVIQRMIKEGLNE